MNQNPGTASGLADGNHSLQKHVGAIRKISFFHNRFTAKFLNPVTMNRQTSKFPADTQQGKAYGKNA